MSLKKVPLALCTAVLVLFSFPVNASEMRPVFIGLDAEFGRATSTADDAIKQGILIAIEEINAAGGCSGGGSWS